MLHPLYPTNVIIAESTSSEDAPAHTDTTVQGPSVADFSGMCGVNTSSEDVEILDYQAIPEKTPTEVSPSDEDLARAINFYNECCEAEEQREDATLSATLANEGTLSLSCSKSESEIVIQQTPDKKWLKVNLETRIQCPSKSDFSGMVSECEKVVERSRGSCEFMKKISLVRNCGSESNLGDMQSFRQESHKCEAVSNLDEQSSVEEHLTFPLVPKLSIIQTSGQATSNPCFELPKLPKNTSFERKSSLKQTPSLKKVSSFKISPTCLEKTVRRSSTSSQIDGDCKCNRPRRKKKSKESLPESMPPKPCKKCSLCKLCNSDHIPCVPCKPYKPSPPPSPPPPQKCAKEAAPITVKITCPPKLENKSALTCNIESGSCCNMCCPSKSDIEECARWLAKSSEGFGGQIPCCPPCCPPSKHSSSVFSSRSLNNLVLKINKEVRDNYLYYALLGYTYKQRLSKAWLIALLIGLGIGLLVTGFALGYLIAKPSKSTNSKTDYPKQSIEPLQSISSPIQEIWVQPTIYEQTTTEEFPLMLQTEPRKNHSNRRNLPTMIPYVRVPFVPNTTWSRPQWTWRCVEKRCQRLSSTPGVPLRSLYTCNMLCDSAKLWPKPTVSMSLATAVVPVRADNFSLEVLSSPSDIVRQHLAFAFQLLQADLVALEKNLTHPPEIELGPPRAVMVRVAVKGNSDVRMKIDTDESYRLSTSNNGDLLTADIRASSFCGARHAFETLSQIVWAEPAGATLLALEAVDIKDTPRFQYRGLLLDTSQHFINVTDIIRTIDGMGANKLNTFHWHVSDSQSFPLRLDSVPQLAEHGSFGPDAVYMTEDVRAVVRRARLRGVRVILEVDLPNAGRAWSWANVTDLGELAHCVEAQPWEKFCIAPPCGHLNPRNSRVYDVLEKIYSEIIELTGVDDVFHMGWSGSPKRCWERNFRTSDYRELWLEYAKQSLAALKRANKGVRPKNTMIWSPLASDKQFLKWMRTENLTLQVWNETYISDIKQQGLRAIISPWNKLFLDCRYFVNCSKPQITWQDMYDYRPWAGDFKWRIDGGEVCLWNQPVDLDKHLWPKGMVLAERLWSDPETKADSEVYLRLDLHRNRLMTRGIESESIWHAWCTQNPNDCVKP